MIVNDQTSKAIVQVNNKPLSTENRLILKNHADSLQNKLQISKPDGFWTSVTSYLPSLPSSKTTGQVLGQAVFQTHGTEWTNNIIGLVARRIMPTTITPELTLAQKLARWASGYVEPTIEETAKMLITPKI